MKQTSTSKEVIKNIEVETTVKSTDELSNENKEVSKKVNRKNCQDFIYMFYTS